jgi:uncharacterized protein (TIGR00369 family)
MDMATGMATSAIELIRTGEVSVPACDLIGAKLIEHGEGTAVYEMPVDAKVANPMGAVQGGIVTSMADAAMAVASVSVLTDDEFVTTSVTTCDIFARFMGPVPVAKYDTLRAEAKVIRAGRTLIWTECDVMADGKLVARFTGTGVKVAFKATQYTETTGKPTTRL